MAHLNGKDQADPLEAAHDRAQKDEAVRGVDQNDLAAGVFSRQAVVEQLSRQLRQHHEKGRKIEASIQEPLCVDNFRRLTSYHSKKPGRSAWRAGRAN